MAEANRRRDVERAFLPVAPACPGESARRRRLDEVAQQQVDLHRVARKWDMPTAFEGYHRPPVILASATPRACGLWRRYRHE